MDALARLVELEAIKQLKYRYMRCIDQKLWKEMEGCFTPDATCSYSGGKYRFEGRDAIMKFLTESMDRPTFLSSHRVHHPEIELTSPTTATGVWALEDFVIDEQYGFSLRGAAFYRDEYVKLGAEWKIRHTGYERTFEEMVARKDSGWRLTQRASGG
jgi:hypothetical protein